MMQGVANALHPFVGKVKFNGMGSGQAFATDAIAQHNRSLTTLQGAPFGMVILLRVKLFVIGVSVNQRWPNRDLAILGSNLLIEASIRGEANRRLIEH